MNQNLRDKLFQALRFPQGIAMHVDAETCKELDDIAASDLDRIIPIIEPYIQALENLVNKVEDIDAHPSFKGMQSLYYIHGFKYDGPNWKAEIDTAKELLK